MHIFAGVIVLNFNFTKFKLQVSHCTCKSSCATMLKENSNRGCPCKAQNVECSVDCRCGTRNKPCKNKVLFFTKILVKMYLIASVFTKYVLVLFVVTAQ